ncbi:response regulator [Nitratireductor thuwali]|uniref:response regulator n=1 Tax=Nitratireductor thuwali TaxID=2267699 RepID=UPI0030CFD8DB
MKTALVVASSPISRIVISRTIERCYIKAIAVTPEVAQREFMHRDPGLVIIDTAAAPDLLHALFDGIAQRRRTAFPALPRVVLICGPGEAERLDAYRYLIDTVAGKPITPDILQPIIDRVIKQHTQPKP